LDNTFLISKHFITEKPGQAGGQEEDAIVPSRLDLRVGKITKVDKVNMSNSNKKPHCVDVDTNFHIVWRWMLISTLCGCRC
jgi:hypothetical protein